MKTSRLPSAAGRCTGFAVLRAMVLAAGSLTSVAVALAQSSVTIYGIIDQGLAKSNNATTTLLSGPTTDAWQVRAGNTSRIGFRGVEDLGDGLYARFHLEHRFAADTGTPSNATVFWLGRSVVAVGDRKWGEVYAGREYSPAYWVALNTDPTYWSYVSQLGTPYGYANYTPVAATIEATNIRWANAVGLKSGTLNGFTVELQTALGEGQRPRSRSGNVQYKSGPLWAGIGFDRLSADTNLVLAAASYEFGPFTPSFSVARARGGINGDAHSYSLSANYRLGQGRVYVNTAWLKPASHLDASMLGVGGEYLLSVRTALYANFGTAQRDLQTRRRTIDFGIKHTF